MSLLTVDQSHLLCNVKCRADPVHRIINGWQ